jgi:glutamate dehydrogenase/leucine dehydrogenase
MFVEKLFESRWLHVSISGSLTNPDLLDVLADLVNENAESFTGVPLNLTGADFDLTAEAYGLFYMDEVEEAVVIGCSRN